MAAKRASARSLSDGCRSVARLQGWAEQEPVNRADLLCGEIDQRLPCLAHTVFI